MEKKSIKQKSRRWSVFTILPFCISVQRNKTVFEKSSFIIVIYIPLHNNIQTIQVSYILTSLMK